MASNYDLIVIGSGAAAQVAALRCRAAGWRVAVVDHVPFGGTCALRGCDPKKVLVDAAAALDHARRMAGKGIRDDTLAIEWGELMAFKRTFTEPVPTRIEAMFAEQGIDSFHGVARFAGPRTIMAGGTRLETRHVLLATGAKPAPLPIQGAQHLTTSDQFLELDALPRRVVFLGGGYIAAEFSHLAARAGASVTVLQRGERLLKRFDSDLVALLTERSQALGISVQTRRAVEAIERREHGYRITVSADGKAETLDADLVVHGGGRVPDLDALDLARGEVAREPDGRLKLNDYLQSVSTPAVYAAGDAAARGPMLTPVAAYDARIAAANLLEGNRRTPDYSVVPSAVFTIPPLAMVGLTEAAAAKRGLRYRVAFQRTTDWFSARHVNEPAAGHKLVIETPTERLLGAHVLGPHADEVINVFAVAMRAGLHTTDLKEMLYAYPTRGSDIRYMV